LVKLHYPPAEVDARVRYIYRRMIDHSPNFDTGNFLRFSTNNLHYLFTLYDRYFFNSFFARYHGEDVTFRLSRRMSRNGGKTTYWKESQKYEICLAIDLLFQTFGDLQRPVVVNGRLCRDRLEATQRILEHELIHLVELVAWGESSCSRTRFRELARRIFNHTDTLHQLVTPMERAVKQFNLQPGTPVQFEFAGEIRQGIVQRITKRATVMVPDTAGSFVDRQRRRYQKYYVPLPMLTPITKGD
jgi:hypothetical protein